MIESKPLANAIEVTITSLPKRHISEETCRVWGYGIGEFKGEPVQVAVYRKPDGSVIGQKIRTRDKDFRWLQKSGAGTLWGCHLWRDGGKMIVITEGEIDAMSVSQMQAHKWPVVSLPSGAGGSVKAIQANIEWLERFDKVVFMYDMDADGQQAAKECSALLTPGKAYIASLRNAKDANELLCADRGSEIIDAIWGAKEYRPDEVLSGVDVLTTLANHIEYDAAAYPWVGLQATTQGCRKGEITTFCAGSGTGKTEVTRAIVSHFHNTNPTEVIGMIELEESVERTALGLMGLYLGRRVHLDPRSLTDSERSAAGAATIGSGRYFLYDHKGTFSLDSLLSRIRFMVRGCGCTTILLDNLTIVASGLDDDDERRALDRAMTKFKAIAQELNFRFLLVHHLKRLQNGSHEEGAQTSLAHLRGTGGIGNYSNVVIGLERDQQDPDTKHLTTLRVLKDRHTGRTGVACVLSYDTNTGLLTEVPAGTVQSVQQKQDEKEYGF